MVLCGEHAHLKNISLCDLIRMPMLGRGVEFITPTSPGMVVKIGVDTCRSLPSRSARH